MGKLVSKKKFHSVAVVIYTMSRKNGTAILLPVTLQMVTDFHNSITVRLVSKFAIKSAMNVPPHLTKVATLPCESLMSKLVIT